MCCAGTLEFASDILLGPSGTHWPLLAEGVESVTLAAVPAEPTSAQNTTKKDVNAGHRMVQATELIMRSLSNLDETLHQSFFLYVAPRARRPPDRPVFTHIR